MLIWEMESMGGAQRRAVGLWVLAGMHVRARVGPGTTGWAATGWVGARITHDGVLLYRVRACRRSRGATSL